VTEEFTDVSTGNALMSRIYRFKLVNGKQNKAESE